jgi:Ser/Thr protein kinase RdoA (MazF antagonist)
VTYPPTREDLGEGRPRAFGRPAARAPANGGRHRLPRLLGGEGVRGMPELEACLREVLGVRSLHVTGAERLKAGVHRLRVGVDDEERSLVAKWSATEVARRNWLVARRWLPAVGLEDVGPSVLAVAAERSGERAWQVQDDLGGRPVCRRPPERADIQALMDAIARVHTALSEHRLLAECRLAGGDRGIEFYAANVRDAQRVLRVVDARRHGAEAASLRDGLLERMRELQEQQPARARALVAAGGAETLLHGDLWTTNALVLRSDGQLRVRLVDWDEAAVGPIAFDLSTLLLRFDPSHRTWILDAYRQAIDRLAGWELPPDDVLNPVLETAAIARLVSLLVWSVAAALDDDSGWLPLRLADLIGWLDGVGPVLPPR